MYLPYIPTVLPILFQPCPGFERLFLSIILFTVYSISMIEVELEKKILELVREMANIRMNHNNSF